MEKDKKRPAITNPGYLKLLAVAAVIYVIATCVMLSDLYNKVGELEHKMVHITGGDHVCK
ncbi:MAG: hypothetical protein WC592_05985 [Candidatus Omnitrophota bacterium]|nr:hypothetical protein [Candidatus Omnitrophota bacterium]